MFPSKALLSFLLVALTAVDATPLRRNTSRATLSFATTIKNTGIANIADQDRARAQALREGLNLQSGKRSASVPITNAVVSYTAQVGVGASDYTLLIDTGSANTWVGASKAYAPGPNSQDTGNTVAVTYGSGSFSGKEFIDTVTLSSDLSISQQSIGVASTSSGFGTGIDGILGVGPVGLTQGTVSNMEEVLTVTDNLYTQGTISEEVLGVYFIPSSVGSSGELTFGGCDTSVIVGDVNYVPITATSPSSNYWGIDQTIYYGATTILATTAGIVDTGTSLILLATDAFQKYQQATGGVLDANTGLLSITSDQYDALQPLVFDIGGIPYVLIQNAQIWPRSLNSDIGGTASGIYLVVSDAGTPSGSGLDFLNGYAFLERYYSVYDTTNQQVGFASTQYTDSVSN